MKVTVISCTENPVETLIFTKNTRLGVEAHKFDLLTRVSEKHKMEELLYMVNTIKSSWEFVDFTIAIEDVTRAFTHQLVRNRHGSYAQQTMRLVDMSDFGYKTGDTILNNPKLLAKYTEAMDMINSVYHELIEGGASIEDARGVLPTNIYTNIVAKFNLRTLAELFSARSSARVQGEYREFMDMLYDAIVEKHEWAGVFLKDNKYDNAEILQRFIMRSNLHQDGKINLIKCLDVLRGAK